MVEHSLGKGEIAGPIPAMGTIDLSHVDSSHEDSSHEDSSHEDSSIGFLMFFSESRKWQKRNLSGQNRT